MQKYQEDFEAWARDCVHITDKLTGAPVPFRLNAPQRRVLAIMERQRLAGRPIRIIMLKARQWGGSTLVQVYMAWMQLCRKMDWSSLICAHVKDASAGIRGMYSALLRDYPDELKPGDAKAWQLSPFEKSQSISWLAARRCRIALATAGSPDSLRGGNYAMAHLSEVAFWGDGNKETAEKIVRTVSGSVARVPDSLIVMESTANGRDNYFYDEWRRAVSGESDKTAVFVPWHEIEIYSREVKPEEHREVIDSLDGYERELLQQGVALESVAWYHDKRREYPTHQAMMAEFPSTPEEAFATSGTNCPFLEPETLPELVEGADEGDEAERTDEADVINVIYGIDGRGTGAESFIISVVPSGKAEMRAAVVLKLSGGALTVIRELDGSGTMPQFAKRVAEECRRLGATLVVAEAAPEGEPGHASWFTTRCDSLGVTMSYDEEERAWLSASGETLASMIDAHHQLTADGRFFETAAEDVESYSLFRTDAPWRCPAVLARLAAAHHLSNRPRPVCLADLLD